MKGCLVPIILLIVLLGLIIGGGIYLDELGVVNLKPVLSKVPLLKKRYASYKEFPQVSFELLKGEELRKLQESIELNMEELGKKEEGLLSKEKELSNLEKELKGKDEELRQKDIALQERIDAFNDREANLDRMATLYQSMSPAKAAAILQNLDDQIVIDIFRRMKGEIVSAVLMQMDPQKAATVSRKMSR